MTLILYEYSPIRPEVHEGRSHEASCGVGSDAAPAGVPRKACTRAAPGLRLAANRSRPPGAWLTEAIPCFTGCHEKRGPVP